MTSNNATGKRSAPEDWRKEIKKDDCFEIASTNFLSMYGAALTEQDGNGLFRAQVFSEWFPFGDPMMVNIVAPTRMLTRQEFEEVKLDLKRKAEQGKAGWPENNQ